MDQGPGAGPWARKSARPLGPGPVPAIVLGPGPGPTKTQKSLKNIVLVTSKSTYLLVNRYIYVSMFVIVYYVADLLPLHM